MRFVDVLGLALEALGQQKVRTLLTTLCVVLGTTVLVISMSVGAGVQHAVLAEISRHGDLRTVRVQPGTAGSEAAMPAEMREVRGTMSEERRQRLKAELARRWRQRHRTAPDDRLTRQRVDELARLDHVRSVVVADVAGARALLGERTEDVLVFPALPDNGQFRGRLIAGDFFSSPDAPDAVVSEFLLYKLGVVDDADLEKVLGRTLRLEFYRKGPSPGLLLLLLNAGRATSLREELVLAKVLQKLPQALDKLDLSPEELEIVRKALGRAPDAMKKPEGEPVTAEFTIRGVVRAQGDEPFKGLWSWVNLDADVVLPGGTAADLFARMPDFKDNGYREVLLEVDSIDHVKEVAQAIKDRGLTAHTLLEYIEAEQFIYLLIFAGMSLIAIIALGVSALGISNTMLMGVLERVREIGVMKAVGAGEGQIQMLFLIEGLLIGLVGGIIGLGLGWAASFPGDAWVRALLAGNTTIKLQESVFAFPWWLMLGAPVFACLLTTLAAVYPARRAARVNTVEALRHE